MGKFLDPFSDQGFKLIFGQESSKELLIEFLNDLLVGERHVEDLTFRDKEIQPESSDGRVIIFDILCRESDGTQFIVEMQNQHQDYFFDRGLYYLCRMVSQQGRKGKDWYYEIYPVYGVYFLNFQLPKLGKLRTDVVLADRETGEQVSGKLRQIYLSLPYFTLGVDECETNFDRWIYMLKNMDRIDLSPFDTRQRVIFDKLLDVANVENLTPRERRQYEENLKNYRDYNGTIATALRTGREEGLAEGMEKGIEKGIAEGKRLLASGMKKEGFAIESIHRLTGLSLEEIDGL